MWESVEVEKQGTRRDNYGIFRQRRPDAGDKKRRCGPGFQRERSGRQGETSDRRTQARRQGAKSCGLTNPFERNKNYSRLLEKWHFTNDDVSLSFWRFWRARVSTAMRSCCAIALVSPATVRTSVNVSVCFRCGEAMPSENGHIPMSKWFKMHIQTRSNQVFSARTCQTSLNQCKNHVQFVASGAEDQIREDRFELLRDEAELQVPQRGLSCETYSPVGLATIHSKNDWYCHVLSVE